jgi:hypothetical protein
MPTMSLDPVVSLEVGRFSTTPPSGTSTLVGKLVKCRQLSKKIAFLDVKVDDVQADSFIELIIKICPSIPSVKEALRPLHLGDTIKVVGDFEEDLEGRREHRTFKVIEAPEVVEKYIVQAGKTPFQPVFIAAGRSGGVKAGGVGLESVRPVLGGICQPVGAHPSPSSPSSASLCKYYTNTGRCPRGSGCLYIHTDDKVLRSEFFKSRDLHRVKIMKSEEGGSCSTSTSPSSSAPPSSQASRTHRASEFADFLVSTFSLNSSSLVLDVAGGRGDMSFELDALRNIPTITVDPRGRKLNKKQRKYIAGGGRDWGDHIVELYHETDFFENHPELLGQVTLIIGYHPDQATEHIFNSGLLLGLPFCVMPCCVFPHSGVSMAFKEWLDYLQGKDEGIERTWINARGRNVVLYKSMGGGGRKEGHERD